MRRHRTTFILALALIGTSAPSQGLFVGPEPPDTPTPVEPPRHPDRRHHHPVELTATDVRVDLVDGIATTTLHQTFANHTGRPREGTWILPLPRGHSVDGFTMEMGGEQVEGEVLDADKARRIYERIVRRRRDPGLLEYHGHGCLRARIFPIPAHDEVEVTVRFRQVLPRTGGQTTWRWPLRAAGLGAAHHRARTTLDLRLRSQKPLRTVYSPMQRLHIVHDDPHQARASLELGPGERPARDLELSYALDDRDFGMLLVTHRPPGKDGWFLLQLAPKRDWPEPENVRRSITFVLDTSGSMSGDKIRQARGALRQFLGSMGKGDWFNVVPFSTEAEPFFHQPVLATSENREAALTKVAALRARGGTNIEDALGHTLRHPLPDGTKVPGGPTTVLPIVVFLTDGLPTVGTTDVDDLLAGLAKANRARARVFVFGVGHDVNTRLLDTLAEDHRGDRDYVRPGQDIEVVTGALFDKLSGPVMTDVSVECEGIEGFDVFPRRTPDLFSGSTLLLVGRYRGAGHHAVRLTGLVDGTRHEYVFEGSFAGREDDHDFLPTLWAQRRIARLLDAIRLNGRKQELVDEVRRLGREYGIVTPFTSHLVLEEGRRVARARGIDRDGARRYFGAAGSEELERIRRELVQAGRTAGDFYLDPAEVAERAKKEGDRARADAEQPAPEVGRLAVDRSVRLAGIAAGSKVRDPRDSAVSLTHVRLGGRNLHLVGGVWVDGGFTAAMGEKVRTVEVFGDEYFALLDEHPDLAPVLAFSSRLLLVVDGEPIEIR